MDKSLPERPALFFDFVLPFRSKDLLPNLWIADPHGTTPPLDGLESSEEILQPSSRMLQSDATRVGIETSWAPDVVWAPVVAAGHLECEAGRAVVFPGHFVACAIDPAKLLRQCHRRASLQPLRVRGAGPGALIPTPARCTFSSVRVEPLSSAADHAR